MCFKQQTFRKLRCKPLTKIARQCTFRNNMNSVTLACKFHSNVSWTLVIFCHLGITLELSVQSFG